MYSQNTPIRMNHLISPFLRFTMEMTTWLWLLIAGLTLNIVYFVLFILSLATMAILNFPGDKAKDGPVSVPGWLRIFNELFFAGILGIFGSYLLFSHIGLILQIILVILVIIFDFNRYLWMLGFKNTPPEYVTYWKYYKK